MNLSVDLPVLSINLLLFVDSLFSFRTLIEFTVKYFQFPLLVD